MHLRVFLSRWRSYRPCPACGGARLRPEALATRIGGKNIAEISGMKIEDALKFMRRSRSAGLGARDRADHARSGPGPAEIPGRTSAWAI